MRSLHTTTADELDFFHGKCGGHCDNLKQSNRVARGKAKVKKASVRRDRRDFRSSRNTAQFMINA